MEPEVLEKYKKAGRICAEIRQEVLKAVKPGMKILELGEMIEDSIRKKGGQPAFPVNISINDITAHYTPARNDEREIQAGELVKIDIGAHVDGYIGDMAFTYCSDKNPLVEGARKLLDAAIAVIRPGVTVGEIGTAIEGKTRELGIGVITNLTGHTLDKYQFHGPPAILNTANNIPHRFKEGDVVAIEPFAVESNGTVKESGTTEIYQYVMDRPIRLTEARQILAMARDEWHGLPFAKRWLYKKISPVKVALAIRQLEQAGSIQPYSVLKEVQGRPVAQAEHTIIVQEKPVITTKLSE